MSAELIMAVCLAALAGICAYLAILLDRLSRTLSRLADELRHFAATNRPGGGDLHEWH